MAINPVMTGAGTNLKLLNAMAHGLPVISTEFGARGYEDLLPYICIRPLESFAPALCSDALPKAPPNNALNPYLWSELAKRMVQNYPNPMSEIA